MDEDYATIEVIIKDSGAVYLKAMGRTLEHCDSIDDALKALERRLMWIRNDMHFESEHDSMEGP
ncbi:MAG: hypothetical protein A2W25_04355 [candidate division Zixibacteria bacterium RBG_16_53_22]|nr:MAG: hypothetical protein A2W25_04355 [candidate division Zixibacteria bacterium RBG_16_53_22]